MGSTSLLRMCGGTRWTMRLNHSAETSAIATQTLFPFALTIQTQAGTHVSVLPLMATIKSHLGAGTGHMIHSRRMDAVFGGWATNLTFQVQTGQPFSVGVADIATANGGSKYAIPVKDPFAPGGTPNPTNPSITCPTKVRTLQHWYNPCAFANPLSGDLISPGPNNGNPNIPQPGYSYPEHVTGLKDAEAFLGGKTNTVYGPGFNRLDMSFFKNFPTIRSQYVQFRVDVFNLANTPEYANPSNSSDGQTGGLITSARTGQVYTPDARFFQLSGKYVF